MNITEAQQQTIELANKAFASHTPNITEPFRLGSGSVRVEWEDPATETYLLALIGPDGTVGHVLLFASDESGKVRTALNPSGPMDALKEAGVNVESLVFQA